MELANDADLRTKAPPEPRAPRAPQQRVVSSQVTVPPRDNRLPMPGTMVVRKYKGKLLEVHVLVDGFAYQGEVYPTLSAVAKVVTGSHTNGFLFFRMGKYGGGR